MPLPPLSEHVVDVRLELPGASRSIVEAILEERRTEVATFLSFSTLCGCRAEGAQVPLLGAWRGAALASAEYWGTVRV